MNDTTQQLVEALRRCVADLEGILPVLDAGGDRLHPGWQTLVEAHAAIAKAGGDA
jgi:hypothetical protein